MIMIDQFNIKEIVPDRSSLFEAYSVLFQISFGFFLIPFKSHSYLRASNLPSI